MRVLTATLSVLLVLAGCSAKKATQASPTASVVATTSPSPTPTPCAVAGATTASARRDGASGGQGAGLLHDVRYTTTACPRVVFEFENVTPPYIVEYRNPPFSQCGSGARVDTSSWGSTAYLVFHSNSASGVDLTGSAFRQTYTKSKDITVPSLIVRRIHETCDFEATLEWVIALDAKHPFKVSTLQSPPRLVIDISQAAA
jgi:hypothetical protein